MEVANSSVMFQVTTTAGSDFTLSSKTSACLTAVASAFLLGACKVRLGEREEVLVLKAEMWIAQGRYNTH